MSGAQKLTPWFPGHIKPVRPGVYQQMSGSGTRLGYQRWDGERWFSWHATPAGAASAVFAVMGEFQNDPWRGLASDPSNGGAL